MARPRFSLFIEQLFFMYDGAHREPDMHVVSRRCDRVLGQLRHYQPLDDDEEINIETAIEMFEALLARAKTKLLLRR